MSGTEKNNNTTTQKSDNTTRVPSPPPPPPSQQSQYENEKEQHSVEKSETEFSKSPTLSPIPSTTKDEEKPNLQISTQPDYVVRVDVSAEEDSVWGDQPTTYNLTRKLSSVEEDVCYPLRTANKTAEIDYNALEEYITEEKIFEKEEGNYPTSPIDSEPKRRVSEFGERIKVMI
jgi:hypothetical protein